jgi:branched-chain amino acid transport system ATP-binding protein
MLAVESLTVAYGSLVALNRVTLEIPERGVLHGVIGPNGAGKSTLMDAITGRIRPTSGRITMAGRDVTNRSAAWRRRHGMARSFQRTSIFPGLGIGEQLELVAHHVGEQDLPAIVEALGLAPMYDSIAGTTAYGDQRRVDIALALLGNPGLILLDEPAAGLSAAETRALFEHLLSLVHLRGMTGVVVEHDVDAVFRFCSAVSVLDLGRLIVTDSPEVVRGDPRVITAYLGEAAWPS